MPIIDSALQFAIDQAKVLSVPEGFLWGGASAAYQVEGFTQADNRGATVWDYYMDELKLGVNGDSGKEAIHFYDRNQYLKDIDIFKQIGLNSYRFSLSWTRIIPDGTGKPNPAGIEHYRQFIKDLKAAGIRPLVTLYHWDMPKELFLQGGWKNRESVQWFKHYAETVFAHFHDMAEDFVLINEPSVEFGQGVLAKKRQTGDDTTVPAILPAFENLADALKTYNHILLSAGAAKEIFAEKGYKGRLGLAFPFFPVLLPKNATSDADRHNAEYADGILNRWFLDAMFKGTYPADILALAEKYQLDTGIQADDAQKVGKAGLEFLGINYYAPLYIKSQTKAHTDYAPEMQLSDGESEVAFNGAVRPDQFHDLLLRIRDEWGNPPVIITENGAGFPNEDKLENGQVIDLKRSNYIAAHITAMKKAIAEGAKVEGYHIWSSHDNLEWLSGYGSRFGMIYVDFATQQRTPKMSAEVYKKIIK
ncbi:MAG: family 1 glycosylhydrolase [Cardiobacteriaceae bacterium]|nr:family 1 glycosylhydrolase [Cardiobacteriaceae bacterium]